VCQESSAQNSLLSRSVSFVRQLKLLCLSDEFFTSAMILLSPVFTYTSVVYGNMLSHKSMLLLDFVHYATYLTTFSITLQIYDSSPGKLALMAFPVTILYSGVPPSNFGQVYACPCWGFWWFLCASSDKFRDNAINYATVAFFEILFQLISRPHPVILHYRSVTWSLDKLYRKKK
jgi:hypothetical protein